MVRFTQAPAARYLTAFTTARTLSATVAAATSTPQEIGSRAALRFFLANDRQSGFAVTADGELVGVFSTVKGRGTVLMEAAVTAGARHLDCFDGFLTAFYSRFGFVETERFANWTPGEPDVVFMALAA